MPRRSWAPTSVGLALRGPGNHGGRPAPRMVQGTHPDAKQHQCPTEQHAAVDLLSTQPGPEKHCNEWQHDQPTKPRIGNPEPNDKHTQPTHDHGSTYDELRSRK